MKKIMPLLTALTASMLPLMTLQAQTVAPLPSATPASTPAVDGSGVKNDTRANHRNIIRSLSPEERRKLRDAHRAALADPAVQAAKASGDKRAAHQAARAAMLRSDPSVAPVLDKIRAETRPERGHGSKGNRTTNKPGISGDQSGAGGQLTFLPVDERTKLVSASRAAQNDPQVAALRQKWVGAITPEAKTQAGRDYRQGLRDAMLRNDPSLASTIQKVQQHREAEAGDMAF